MYYFNPLVKINLDWRIMKGLGKDPENFAGSEVCLFLIGKCHKIPVSPIDLTSGDGHILATLKEGLPEGVYGFSLIWFKNERSGLGRCIMRTERRDIFCISPSAPVVSEASIAMQTTAASYGYDGLSAYELSVLKGKTKMSEEEWLVWQNGIPAEVESEINGRFLQDFGNAENRGMSQKAITEAHDDLQEQINALVAGKAVVGLSVSPALVFVGEESNISLQATTDTEATDITIKKGEVDIATGEGVSLVGSDIITPPVAGNTTYLAEFTIAGITKTATKNVVAVYPVLYGAGQAYTGAQMQASPRTTPAGTYNIEVQNDGDSVFFVVPRSMSIGDAKMSGFDFPLQAPVDVEIDGVAYKSYQSANTYNAVTLNIVIS